MKILLLGSATLALIAAVSLTASTAPPAKPATAEAQIDAGKKLYTDKCSKCHGDAGQGTKDGPPVVGKDAFPLDPRAKSKRDVKFHTAADVFGWATKNMPPKKAGSLTTDEYLEIFAFDLTANGVKLDAVLDGPAAAKIVLHP